MRGNFNPRSPHGERPRNSPPDEGWKRFQSTLPARGATSGRTAGRSPEKISIHAPRTGSDTCPERNEHDDKNFNPRSPHGERRCDNNPGHAGKHFNPRSPHGERRSPLIDSDLFDASFQSTLPARGATTPPTPAATLPAIISIHAPRTGSDHSTMSPAAFLVISIHAPRTGSDFVLNSPLPCRLISIHAPRTGSDGGRVKSINGNAVFQSTLPARGATV